MANSSWPHLRATTWVIAAGQLEWPSRSRPRSTFSMRPGMRHRPRSPKGQLADEHRPLGLASAQEAQGVRHPRRGEERRGPMDRGGRGPLRGASSASMRGMGPGRSEGGRPGHDLLFRVSTGRRASGHPATREDGGPIETAGGDLRDTDGRPCQSMCSGACQTLGEAGGGGSGRGSGMCGRSARNVRKPHCPPRDSPVRPIGREGMTCVGRVSNDNRHDPAVRAIVNKFPSLARDTAERGRTTGRRRAAFACLGRKALTLDRQPSKQVLAWTSAPAA
jgi:hypothetical protein